MIIFRQEMAKHIILPQEISVEAQRVHTVQILMRMVYVERKQEELSVLLVKRSHVELMWARVV